MGNSLAKNAIFNTVYKVLNVFFPLVSVTYVSRVLSPDGIGDVAYAKNIVSYFLMVATMGISKHGVRVIAQLRDNTNAVDKAFTELIIINFTTTTACVCVFYLLLKYLFPSEPILLAVCGIELLFNYLNIDWFYQGKEEYVYIVIRNIIIKIISLILIFLFVKERGDYIIYAAISCTAMGFNYLFNVIHARRSVHLTFHDLNIRQHLKPLLVFLVSSTISSLYSKFDVTMLGIMSTSLSVGYYTTAYKIILLVLTLVTSVTAVFFPRLSYAYNTNKNEFNKIVNTGLKIILMLEIPACIGLITVAENVVAVLFGVMYKPVVVTIRIMAVIILIRGMCDLLCYQVLICTGNEKHLMKGYLAGAIVNIVLNSLLIGPLAHDGAAVATLITELAVNGILLLYAKKVLLLSISIQFWKSIFLGIIGMLAIVIFIQHMISNSIVALPVSIVCGLISYFLILYLSRNEELERMIEKIELKRN